jgi:hypothetical protein
MIPDIRSTLLQSSKLRYPMKKMTSIKQDSASRA